jgi:hypothetical protein
MKLDLKEINFKQFFLRHGEWVGLGIALAIALPFLVLGTGKALFSGSAAANAGDVDKLAKKVENDMRTSIPPPDADKAPPESEFMVNFSAVEPQKFAQEFEWFVPSSIEDTKRRSPEVLAPGELQVAYLQGATKLHIVWTRKEGTQVYVIEEKDAPLPPKVKERLERYKKLQGSGTMGGLAGMPGGKGAGGMGAGGMGGMMGAGGAGGMQGMMGMGGMMGRMGMGAGAMGGMMGRMGGIQTPQAGSGSKFRELTWMDLDKVKEGVTRLAEELVPARMIIITGSFPYKQQLESFRIALRKRSLNELVGSLGTDDVPWQFRGFEIQRRVLYPDGREKSGWEDHHQRMRDDLRLTLAHAVDIEPEDPDMLKYNGVVNYGLVLPRPKLELPYDPDPEKSRYPNLQIPGVQETINKLNEISAGDSSLKPPEQLQSRLSGKNIDPLSPFQPVGNADETEKTEPTAPTSSSSGEKKKSEEGKEEPDPVVPEKALVRIIDTLVAPGFTYEYRIKVKMSNPNYNRQKDVAYPKLAKEKEIEASEWTYVPPVSVPADTFWYALDDKPDRDKAMVQVQRWVDLLEDRGKGADQKGIPVGDWLVLNKTPVYRGEYIGGVIPIEVATWNIRDEDYELVKDAASRSTRKLPVDFRVRSSETRFPALLVDYAGGKDMRVHLGNKDVKEDAPVEVLVLNSDGRLELHSSAEDLPNAERKGRAETYKKRMESVKQTNRLRRIQGPGLFDRNAMPGMKGGKGGGGGT